jgi:hypothetical protein
MQAGRKVYNSPRLTIHGDIAEITEGLSRGFHTDAAFPAHVNRRDLTFS